MISALLVTAIPVTPTEAAPTNVAGWDKSNSDDCFAKSESTVIPEIDASAKIYKDGSENFTFAYVDVNGKDDATSLKEKFAVILDFDRNQSLAGGTLKIPARMDAYVRITDSGSTNYAAANRAGRPLYYKEIQTTTTQVAGDPVLTSEDLNGDGLFNDYIESVKPVTTQGFVRFKPCLKAEESVWSPDGVDVPLYYYEDGGNGIPPASALYLEDGPGTDEDGDGNPDTDPKWTQTNNDTTIRISDAIVRYIGSQYYDEKATDSPKIKDSTLTRSVFGGDGEGNAAAQIISLTFEADGAAGSPVIGIGEYAFQGCTNIASISLGNGLNTLGNYSFANCANLNFVQLPYNTNLNTIGAFAFQNCTSLQEFALPTNVRVIGDYSFRNCVKLKTFDMSGKSFDPPKGDDGQAITDLSVTLHTIGYRAFENCESLESLELPRSYEGNDFSDSKAAPNVGTKPVFHISTVKGCTSLKYIKTPSTLLRLVTDAESDATVMGDDGKTYYVGGYDNGSGTVDGSYDFSAFKADVGEEFYFEAPRYMSNTSTEKTPVHNVANIKHICFKWLNEDRYEIEERSLGINADNKIIDVGLVFVVNGPNQLVYFHVENPTTGEVLGVKVPEITMPRVIGPHFISEIIEGSFNNNCWLQKITIPPFVTTIGSNAFKGCHNLKHVIFEDATAVTSIGSGAFAAQQVDSTHGMSGASGKYCTESPEDNLTPFMSFTGVIEKEDGTNTEPFKYAMKSTSNINIGQQLLSYITYYSGMPTNLTVKYNPDTGMSELQYFPTKKDVMDGFELANPQAYLGAYKPFTGSVGDTFDPDAISPGRAFGDTDAANTGYFRFPYMSASVAAEAAGAFQEGGGTENQTNMRNGVENIVIPNGVNSIREGLFSGLNTEGFMLGSNRQLPDPADTTGYEPPAPDVKTLTVKSVAEIKPYTFARMPEMTAVYVSGAMTVGDYAFDKCVKLESAEIGPAATTLGRRPFSGCKNLSTVTFPDSAYFDSSNGIIYGIETNTDGSEKTKKKIIECLEGRGSTVGSRVAGPDEFATITEIAEEAFMDCDSVRQVDLSSSSVKEIPIKAFAEMDNLNVVILPGTAAAIRDGAFWNTASLASVTIPNNVIVIAPDAFAEVPINDDGTYGDPLKTRVTMMSFDFIANVDSTADLYAKGYDYIDVTQDDTLRAVHTVMLFDAVDETNPKFYKSYQVRDGENLELTILDINDHTGEGYQFSRWWPSADIFNPIVDDTEIWAMYVPIGARTYTVRFFDINKEEMTEYTQQVVEGRAARAPSKDEMEVEGKIFTGWDRDITNITSNLDVYAQYTDRASGKYYIAFYTDMDLATLIGKVQEVNEGESAIEPAHPTKEGYVFSRWSSDGWQNVTRDWDIFALYDADGSNGGGNDNPPGGGDDNNGGGGGGGDNSGGNGGGGGGGDSNNNNDDSVSGNATKYKVVVSGGSGSGDYTAGTIVPINAYARADGTVFDKWTSSSDGVGFVNQTAISTTFTMPANNVEITANFKVGGGSSTVSGNSRSTRRNSTTTVDVSKGGISNTDIASATVNGSSDNYVVRITDDAQATAAVIAALEAQYGDLGNIAYLPMDISLYDATGSVKITDIAGISVDITLPLPDELIPYAGNNRAGSVVNGRLENLNTRFTTIDGVPCVQFTATHFSPYTIYVDTANLSAGTIDATPKTGDPIHPKWFLAMGLACISIVLFCKKDKQPKVKHA